MKVLHPTTTFPQNEDDHWGPFVRQLCESIASEGIEVEVLAANTSDSKPLDTRCEVSRFDYFLRKRFQTLMTPPGLLPNIRNRPWRAVQLPFFYRSLASQIERKSFGSDLLHAHWLIPTGFAAVRRSEAPVLATVWGAEYHIKPDGILGRLVRRTQEEADRLVAVSEYLRNRGIEEFGCDPDKIEVVPNAVDTEVFAPGRSLDVSERFGLSESDILVTTVRRLVPEKRVEDVLSAAEEVLDSRNDVSFLIVGDGPERRRLERMAEDLSISENVFFTGHLPHHDIPGVMADSDITLLTTEQEGLATTLLESMASGTPVVATRGTGNDEVIEDGYNGFMYETGSISELAERVEELVADPDKRSRMAENAREEVIKNFSYEKAARRYVSIYEEMLE